MKPETFKTKIETAWPERFELLTEYTGGVDPITFRCRKCGEVVYMKRAGELLWEGCPNCDRPEDQAPRAPAVRIPGGVARREHKR